MEGLFALLVILGAMNESSDPVWSEMPQECKQITFEPSDYEKGTSDVDALFHSSSIKNAKARLEKTLKHSYICGSPAHSTGMSKSPMKSKMSCVLVAIVAAQSLT